jgi:NAD/NADP transhydrogenase beta subunit
MSFSRRIELVSGIVTGLLWLAYWVALDRSIDGLSVEGFLSGFIFFGIPGLLVAIGAYAHAVREKAWGRVVLMVGCSLLILVFLLFFVGGIAYWGLIVLFATLAPSLTGIITVLASRANDLDGM